MIFWEDFLIIMDFFAKARCDILKHEKSASIFFDTLYDDRN